MTIHHYNLGPMDNNTYLIVDEATKEAALVDPSFESEKILSDITANGYKLRYILNTHGHFDHIIGNAFFARETGAPIALHRLDLDFLRRLEEQGAMFGFEVVPSPDPTIYLEDNQTITLGETQIKVLFTPGHAPGHVTFVIEDEIAIEDKESKVLKAAGMEKEEPVRETVALVGDCLFSRSIGRTDLPGGSLQTLLHSIRTRLLTLPDATRVLPGHGKLTTIGNERRRNPYIQPEE